MPEESKAELHPLNLHCIMCESPLLVDCVCSNIECESRKPVTMKTMIIFLDKYDKEVNKNSSIRDHFNDYVDVSYDEVYQTFEETYWLWK